MLDRISSDVAGFAASQRGRQVPYVTKLSPRDVAAMMDVGAEGGVGTCQALLEDALQGLLRLSVDLQAVQRQGARFVEAAVSETLLLANQVPLPAADGAGGNGTSTEQLRFLLLRHAGLRATADFDFVTSTAISSSAPSDLANVNPFLGDGSDQVQALVLATLLHASRISAASRALGQLRGVCKLLGRLRKLLPRAAAQLAAQEEADGGAGERGAALPA